MNVKEAAEYLTIKGYHCAPGTVRALARHGRLKCYRPGVTKRGPMQFTLEMLDVFLALEVIGGQPMIAKVPTVRAPKPKAVSVANGKAIDYVELLREEREK